jgi:hypothetical protein
METGISIVAVGESAAGHSHRECILMYNVCATSAFIEAQIEFNCWFKNKRKILTSHCSTPPNSQLLRLLTVPSSGCKNVTQPQLHPFEGIYN